MSIWICGDCHGNFTRFSSENFPQGKELTKKDYVIILGDCGLIWSQAKDKNELNWRKWLNNKPWTTLFIQGNHENHSRLESDEFETKEWKGGKIKVIESSIYMLNYGEIFNIDGCKILSTGKARSHDIQHGIIDPGDYTTIKEMKQACKNLEKQHGGWQFTLYRIKGIDWWEQEVPTAAEREYCLSNLNKNNNKVDYVLSHEFPSSCVTLLSAGYFKPDEYSFWLEDNIRTQIEYTKWYGGHYHVDREISDKEICYYNKINRIW